MAGGPRVGGLLGVVLGLSPAAHRVDPCAATPPAPPPSCTAPTVAGFASAGLGWFEATCQMCDARCPVPLKTGQSSGCGFLVKLDVDITKTSARE